MLTSEYYFKNFMGWVIFGPVVKTQVKEPDSHGRLSGIPGLWLVT